MSKKGQIHLTPGLIMRLIGGIFIILSIPFIVANPFNIYSLGAFGAGNFFMLVGGAVQ